MYAWLAYGRSLGWFPLMDGVLGYRTLKPLFEMSAMIVPIKGSKERMNSKGDNRQSCLIPFVI